MTGTTPRVAINVGGLDFHFVRGGVIGTPAVDVSVNRWVGDDYFDGKVVPDFYVSGDLASERGLHRGFINNIFRDSAGDTDDLSPPPVCLNFFMKKG